MKAINHDLYLNKLIQRKENHLIKIVTGIQRKHFSFRIGRVFA